MYIFVVLSCQEKPKDDSVGLDSGTQEGQLDVITRLSIANNPLPQHGVVPSVLPFIYLTIMRYLLLLQNAYSPRYASTSWPWAWISQ